MSLVLALAMQLMPGQDVVPAVTDIPVDDGFENASNAAIDCPYGSYKRTKADTFDELLAGDRKQLDKDQRTYQAPRLKRLSPASYPLRDWQAGTPGFVSVAVLVDEGGRVAKTEIVCSTNERFEQEALKAVKQFEYQPARSRGNPVRDIAIQPFRFGFDQ